MSVRFDFEWIDEGSAPRDGFAGRTMAELSITAGGEPVTAVLDREERSYRDHVVVPLLGVAEWLVCNWWHVFCEIGDRKQQKPDFESRHDLAFAGDGFVLPRLVMAPLSPDRVRLGWRRYRPEHARIEFVGDGEEMVEPRELEEQFRGLVGAVLERLRGAGMAATTLAEDWAAIDRLDPGEREFCRAAALLGADPFDVSAPLTDAIMAAWNRLDPSARDDALAVSDAESLPRVADWVARSAAGLDRKRSGSGWRELREQLPPASPGPPWRQGFELARSARLRLGVEDGRFEFESRLEIGCRVAGSSPSPRIQGLVAADAPTCVAVAKDKPAQRFLTARALGDYLGRTEPAAGLLSSLSTDRQARSRAFAAEFLAPAASLKRRLPSDGVVEAADLDRLGREHGVSSMVVRHQIENHQLADVANII